MREMSKSAPAVAREALAVGRAALPRYASRFSRRRRDGYPLPQLFAALVVRKFLRQDYRWIEALGEWSELRAAIGLADGRVPDHSTLCLAEAKLASRGLSSGWRPASRGRGTSAAGGVRRRCRARCSGQLDGARDAPRVGTLPPPVRAGARAGVVAEADRRVPHPHAPDRRRGHAPRAVPGRAPQFAPGAR